LLESTEYVTQDFAGDIKILGELQNVGNSDVSFVKIIYTFRDASGALLDTAYAYVHGSSKKVKSVVTDTILSTNEVGSFQLYTFIAFNLVSSMSYVISFENYDTMALLGEIKLYGELVEREDFFGDLEILGELKNEGSILAYFLKFVSTAKNNVGQVIDVDFTNIDGVNVELNSGITTDTGLYPRQIASFEIYSSAEYSKVDDVTYKINWNEGDVTTYSLNIDKSGDGKGTISSTPSGVNCGIYCSFNYAQNTLVTLSAKSDPGFEFSGWSGEGCSGTKSCTVIMDSNKYIFATFTKVTKVVYLPWIPLLLDN
jgi:hypothetical protein